VADCSIPPLQNPDNYFQAEDGRAFCSSSSAASVGAVSEEDIHALAVAYAPVLFFHPLEEYTLQTADTIFTDPSKGNIFKDVDGEYILVDDTLNLTSLLLTSQGPEGIISGDTHFFEYTDPGEEYKRGAGFTFDGEVPNRGLSQASIYYNVVDYSDRGGTWVINYFFYYAWQGPQTFGFSTGDRRYYTVELDPYAKHEGDWEAMSVLICAPEDGAIQSTPNQQQQQQQADPAVLPQPLAVTYQQHSFSQITDCTKGECIFWKDTKINPVGFVSLGIHATYPVASRNIVYGAYPFNILYFFPGFFFLADQTVFRNEETGDYRMFFPTPSNLIRHQDPEDIILNVSPESEYWQGYGGKWGESREEDSVVPPTVPAKCFNAEQSAYVDECPNVPLVNAIVRFLQSCATQAIGAVIPGIAEFLQGGKGPTGPARKGFFYEWAPPESANLYYCVAPFDKLASDEEQFCRWLGDPIIDKEDEDEYDPGITAMVVGILLRTTTVASNIVGFFVASCWPFT
jgi:hypothetical protein